MTPARDPQRERVFLETLADQARQAAERSATAQGLPVRITDRAALQQIAALLRGEVSTDDR